MAWPVFTKCMELKEKWYKSNKVFIGLQHDHLYFVVRGNEPLVGGLLGGFFQVGVMNRFSASGGGGEFPHPPIPPVGKTLIIPYLQLTGEHFYWLVHLLKIKTSPSMKKKWVAAYDIKVFIIMIKQDFDIELVLSKKYVHKN